MNVPARFPVEQLGVLEQTRAHAHACLLYESREEQFAAAIPFINRGLARGQACAYVLGGTKLDELRGAMQAGGIEVDSEVRSGRLSILTRGDAYTRYGLFQGNWTIGEYKKMADVALSQGFAGFCAAAEMDWALEKDCPREELIEFERRVNYLIPDGRFPALCQYDMRRFPAETIAGVIRTHPIVVYGGQVYTRNPFYVPPEETLHPNRAEAEVRRMLATLAS